MKGWLTSELYQEEEGGGWRKEERKKGKEGGREGGTRQSLSVSQDYLVSGRLRVIGAQVSERAASLNSC